jgi:hypothetical protein
VRIGDRNELMMSGLIVAGKTLFRPYLDLIVAERRSSVSFNRIIAGIVANPRRGILLFL